MSASHTALASIRMERTYITMGEAADIAAARSIKEKVAVRDVNQTAFRKELVTADMILEWDVIVRATNRNDGR